MRQQAHFDSTKGGRYKAEWALRLLKLGVGRAGLAMIFDMSLGCFRSMVLRVLVVAAG
jgi:hypothetical protein